ncbi:MAG: S-methyl-5-thioribose-1-phosphate isomerase [Chloroflexi bacterium]|nr:S-methyl-5-thioribose-1-phosphate isomerase [Chloroflexota bacterium]
MDVTAATQPLEWRGDRLAILDQTCLPGAQVCLEAREYTDVARAIKEMCVRGAPAIGVAGAYGAALGALAIKTGDREEFLRRFGQVLTTLAATRPTAVNLAWALKRVEQAASRGIDVPQIKALIVEEAQKVHRDEQEATDRLSRYGSELIAEGDTVMTHCNAGALATCGCGTALGVIRAAVRQGKRVHVMASETRPLLQGARLTAYELLREKIPVTLIADSAAGHFLSHGKVNCVITGADRVAANGDVANKIGTYSLAVLAAENGVPFYVAAPLSTIDLSIASGDKIAIEERGAEEVTHIRGIRIAPEGVVVANPAFDITPANYVTALVTDRGVARHPYLVSLRKLFEGQ